MKPQTKIIIAAISAIFILEIVALLKGVNSTLFALTISAIAGLAGYEVKSVKDKLTN